MHEIQKIFRFTFLIEICPEQKKTVKAEIITIGDEILIGQTIDSNSAWIGRELHAYGVEIEQITSISDNVLKITEALDLAFSRSDLILMTGGLGPTNDDITKKCVAKYFNVGLKVHEPTLEHIVNRFTQLSIPISQINKDQALVPENAEVLFNTKGTAPGMLFRRKERTLVCMPGVPYEMKSIVKNHLIPILAKANKDIVITHKTITMVNVPESVIATKIEDIEKNLPEDIKLAYLPHLHLVRMRLSGRSSTKTRSEMETQIDAIFDEIKSRFPKSYFEGELSLSEIVGQMLQKQNKRLVTIESCTGGFLAHSITAIPGSSAFYSGSIIPYSYDLKTSLLQVDPTILAEKGAVSEEVVRHMSEYGLKLLNADFAISTSGIAGPTGGTETKPVGMVWVAISQKNGKTISKKLQLRGERLQVIERTTIKVLEMLRQCLLVD